MRSIFDTLEQILEEFNQEAQIPRDVTVESIIDLRDAAFLKSILQKCPDSFHIIVETKGYVDPELPEEDSNAVYTINVIAEALKSGNCQATNLKIEFKGRVICGSINSLAEIIESGSFGLDLILQSKGIDDEDVEILCEPILEGKAAPFINLNLNDNLITSLGGFFVHKTIHNENHSTGFSVELENNYIAIPSSVSQVEKHNQRSREKATRMGMPFFKANFEKSNLAPTSYLIPEKNFKKYNDISCCKIHFTEEGLDNLKRKYRNVRGLPGFLHHLMKGRSTKEREFMLQQPFIWSPNQTAVTVPNALFDFSSKKCTLDSLKDQPGGFGLVAWAVHPLLLTKYKWGNARQYNHRESFKKFLSLNSNNDLPPETNFFHRVNSQEKIADIESQHPSTYLTSILDLTAEHLPYLRKLKEANLVHLIDNYGVDINKDLVEMYFHFPYPEHNTTLHLHVRVNQGAHPMERTRSFSLNEVINCLEKEDRIYDLILARDTIYSENMEFLQNIEGVTLIETTNPFFRTTPLIQCNDSNISQGSFKIRGLEI